jgi:hypothetical protein
MGYEMRCHPASFHLLALSHVSKLLLDVPRKNENRITLESCWSEHHVQATSQNTNTIFSAVNDISRSTSVVQSHVDFCLARIVTPALSHVTTDVKLWLACFNTSLQTKPRTQPQNHHFVLSSKHQRGTRIVLFRVPRNLHLSISRTSWRPGVDVGSLEFPFGMIASTAFEMATPEIVALLHQTPPSSSPRPSVRAAMKQLVRHKSSKIALKARKVRQHYIEAWQSLRASEFAMLQVVWRTLLKIPPSLNQILPSLAYE